MNITSPYSIQIELVQGCNRRCACCGIGSYVDKTIKYMNFATMEKIAKECKNFVPERRFELAMHGEPTLHPNLITMIHTLRKEVPKAQIQLTTNGFKLHDCSLTMELFRHGLDFIVLDTYDEDRVKLRKCLESYVKLGVNIIEYYSPDNTINPYYNHKRKLNKTIIVMDDLTIQAGRRKNRVLLNLAGNAPNQPWIHAPLHKVCTNMFRELSICYDGSVNICCMDFAHEYTCGNINNRPIVDIWYGEEFNAARRFVRNKKRYFSPCARCNYSGGARSGLLPKIEEPTEHDIEIIREILNKSKHNNELPIIDFFGKKVSSMQITRKPINRGTQNEKSK